MSKKYRATKPQILSFPTGDRCRTFVLSMNENKDGGGKADHWHLIRYLFMRLYGSSARRKCALRFFFAPKDKKSTKMAWEILHKTLIFNYLKKKRCFFSKNPGARSRGFLSFPAGNCCRTFVLSMKGNNSNRAQSGHRQPDTILFMRLYEKRGTNERRVFFVPAGPRPY